LVVFGKWCYWFAAFICIHALLEVVKCTETRHSFDAMVWEIEIT